MQIGAIGHSRDALATERIAREQQVQRRPRVPLHRVPLCTCELVDLESLTLESRPQDLEIDQVDGIEFDIVDCIDGG